MLTDMLTAMPEPKHLIYGLIDPRTLMVRYVGKSSTGMRRPRRHRHRSEFGHNPYKDRWIAQLIEAGLNYEIAVLQESSLQCINDDEMWWIEYGRASEWPLTNLTSGGEGGDTFSGRQHTDEARAKIAASRIGKEASAETKAKIGASHKGIKWSDSHRAIMSEIGKRNPPSALCIAESIAANTGRKPTAETIEKMKEIGKRESNMQHLARVSAGNIGRKHSPETLAKLRGQKRSPEAIANMKAAWVRRRAREQGGDR